MGPWGVEDYSVRLRRVVEVEDRGTGFMGRGLCHNKPKQNVVRPLRYISNLIDLFGRGRKIEFCTIGE